MPIRRYWLVPAGMVLAVVVSGAACTRGEADCTPVQPARAAIAVDEPVDLADQPVHIQISGLDPGQTVEVSARALDWQQQVWQAHATFVADDDGALDMAEDAPRSGTYQGADGMGLFWSMNPPTGDPDHAWFAPLWPEAAAALRIDLAVCAGADELARTSLTRQWLADGVTHRALSLTPDGLAGDLYLPAEETDPRSGVLLLGGSGGGSHKYEAALLASRGHPALALTYFGAPGLPDRLQDVPLEYFAAGAEFLVAQSETGLSSVAVLGYSRGGEAALLSAQHFPELVSGAVVYAGSHQVMAGFPGGGAAWTLAGEPLPQQEIPLDNLAGPVLAVAGGDDASFWPADYFAGEIMAECESAQVEYACQSLIYPDAGHMVGTYPFQANGTAPIHPVTGESIDWGGTREANEAARRDSWPQVLAFLADLPPG